jgi:hypothetical protein
VNAALQLSIDNVVDATDFSGVVCVSRSGAILAERECLAKFPAAEPVA